MALEGFDLADLTAGIGEQLQGLFGSAGRAAAGGDESFADTLGRAGFQFRDPLAGLGQLNAALGAHSQARGADTLARLSQLGAWADPFARLGIDPGAVGGYSAARTGSLFDAGNYGWLDARNAKAAEAAAQERAGAAGKPGTVSSTVTESAGAVGDGTGDAETAHWRPLIDEAAAEFGVDADILQAIIGVESQGIPSAGSPAGAMGLGQVMPENFGPGEDPWDPKTNIRVAARVLREKYEANGRDWNLAIRGYHGFGHDGFTSDEEYLGHVQARVNRIKAKPRAGGPAGDLSTAWGGIDAPISQEFGTTDFSTGAGASIYDFGAQFGLDGDQHSGLDIGLAYGSAVYSPVAGTVVIAGGSGVYTDVGGGPDAPGKGELRIRLDNGEELILGHLSAINLAVGQRVTAGQLVGASGDAASPHLHLEWRVRDASTPSGWKIVDPRTRLRHNGPVLPPGHHHGDGHNHG